MQTINKYKETKHPESQIYKGKENRRDHSTRKESSQLEGIKRHKQLIGSSFNSSTFIFFQAGLWFNLVCT